MAVKQHVNESDHVPNDSEQSTSALTPDFSISSTLGYIEKFKNGEFNGLANEKFCELMVLTLGKIKYF